MSDLPAAVDRDQSVVDVQRPEQRPYVFGDLLSIEITRECPLRCPGCYAYDDAHLGGGGVTLRSLNDRKGEELITGVLRLVDRLRPLRLEI